MESSHTTAWAKILLLTNYSETWDPHGDDTAVKRVALRLWADRWARVGQTLVRTSIVAAIVFFFFMCPPPPGCWDSESLPVAAQRSMMLTLRKCLVQSCVVKSASEKCWEKMRNICSAERKTCNGWWQHETQRGLPFFLFLFFFLYHPSQIAV